MMMMIYVIIAADDKVQSKKLCELCQLIITVNGSSSLGGCMYTLDCIIGVIPMLVFPVCGCVDI
jgi:hypothetical protein